MLAQESGITYSHLSRMENGIKVPAAASVVRLSRALDCDLSRLLRAAQALPEEVLDLLPNELAEPDDASDLPGLSHSAVHRLRRAVEAETRQGSTERAALLSMLSAFERHEPPPLSNPLQAVSDFHAGTDYFPDKVAARWASAWSVTYHGHYKRLTVRAGYEGAGPVDETEYILVQRGAPLPEPGRWDEAHVIQVPIERLWDGGHSLLAACELLGRSELVAGWVYQPPGINYLPSLATRQDEIPGLSYSELSNEAQVTRVLEESPDVFIYYGEAVATATLSTGGLPCLYFDPFNEHPLGSAEQLKFLSLFTNQEALANTIFDGIERRYTKLKELAARQPARKRVLVGRVKSEQVWEAQSKAWMRSQLLADAGAVDVLEGLPADAPAATSWTGPTFDLTQMLGRSHEAEFIYSSVYWRQDWSPGALGIDRPLLQMRAYQRGKVIHAGARGEDIFHTGGIRVDTLLADLIHYLHPQALPAHSPVFHSMVVDAAPPEPDPSH